MLTWGLIICGAVKFVYLNVAWYVKQLHREMEEEEEEEAALAISFLPQVPKSHLIQMWSAVSVMLTTAGSVMHRLFVYQLCLYVLLQPTTWNVSEHNQTSGLLLWNSHWSFCIVDTSSDDKYYVWFLCFDYYNIDITTR